MLRFLAVRAVLLCTVVSAFSARTAFHRSSASTRLAASNINEIFPMRKGSTVAIVTPMKEETGEIDYVGLKKLLQLHVEGGTKNLCILGTTGEASTINMKEREKILKTAVEQVKGKMSILAGTGTINPNSVREMTLQAIDVGCDAALVVCPYYVKPPQRGLIKHMTDAADLGLPVIMYNIPGRAGIDFADSNMAIAAEYPNIIGLKDATGNLDRVASMRSLVDPDFLLYSGDDSTSLDFIMLGGDGCISVTANVAPKPMSVMVDAALAGDLPTATMINDQLMALHKTLFLEGNPMPTKWALYHMGYIGSPSCRPPMATFDYEKFGSQVEAAIQQSLDIDTSVLSMHFEQQDGKTIFTPISEKAKTEQ